MVLLEVLADPNITTISWGEQAMEGPFAIPNV